MESKLKKFSLIAGLLIAIFSCNKSNSEQRKPSLDPDKTLNGTNNIWFR